MTPRVTEEADQPRKSKSQFNKKKSLEVSSANRESFEAMKESMIEEPETPKNRVLSTSIAMHSVRHAKRATLGKFDK